MTRKRFSSGRIVSSAPRVGTRATRFRARGRDVYEPRVHRRRHPASLRAANVSSTMFFPAVSSALGSALAILEAERSPKSAPLSAARHRWPRSSLRGPGLGEDEVYRGPGSLHPDRRRYRCRRRYRVRGLGRPFARTTISGSTTKSSPSRVEPDSRPDRVALRFAPVYLGCDRQSSRFGRTVMSPRSLLALAGMVAVSIALAGCSLLPGIPTAKSTAAPSRPAVGQCWNATTADGRQVDRLAGHAGPPRCTAVRTPCTPTRSARSPARPAAVGLRRATRRS